jgi:hypothetical protein
LGTLDIAPNTKLVLTYDEKGSMKATLVFGCAMPRRRKQQVKLLPRKLVALVKLIQLKAAYGYLLSAGAAAQ